MNKCIIAISGNTQSKNMFREVVEGLGYKIKGADCDQELQKIIQLLGWSGDEHDSRYYDFYNSVFKLANDTYNFKETCIKRAVEDFQEDKDYQILVVKGSNEFEKQFEEEIGLFNLFIAKNQLEVIENELKYDKVILVDDLFSRVVEDTMNILIKKEIEKV